MSEVKQRRKKREREISLAMEAISPVLESISKNTSGQRNILEFGSGDGFQIPYLRRFGKVIASDIYVSEELKEMDGEQFVKCSITKTPFADKQFDLIFSNHVFEHVEDRKSACIELNRIGSSECVYAFSVPTNIWLLLSIPAQYRNKLRTFWNRLIGKRIMSNSLGVYEGGDVARVRSHVYQWFLPGGHGIYPGFIECYRALKINAWRRIFLEAGFSILEIKPLLLYAPSEFSFLPVTTRFNRFGLCSSVLFMMRRSKNSFR